MDERQDMDTDINESIDDNNRSFFDTSQYEELNYGELEQSLDIPTFELSSPISSISSTTSSPEKTTVPNEMVLISLENLQMNDSSEFVSLEELNSQISPPSDLSGAENTSTLTRRSILETIYEDIYLETPPGTPSSSNPPTRKRRLPRMDLSKCDEFKENVQKNHSG